MKIAVIPARGGSKRIPRKNIRPFAGKPMIGYAIDAAKNSNQFDHIVVSTDDNEIASIAQEFGAEIPFIRPEELADDHTPTVPVIQHAISACTTLGWDIEAVCCIYPAVPLIQAQKIQEAYTLMVHENSDYAFPITRFPSAIQRALRQLPNGAMTPFYPEYVLTRSQDLEPAFYDVGQFYWGTTEAWIRGESPHSSGKGLLIPEWQAVDIDTPEDWQRAELYCKLINMKD